MYCILPRIINVDLHYISIIIICCVHHKVGNSSSSFAFFSTFFSFFALPLILSMRAWSSSFTSSEQALSNKASLSLSSASFLSIYSNDSGANNFRLSNKASIWIGISNFFFSSPFSWFFFFCFFPFLTGDSSSLLFLDWRTSNPFSFFHSAALLSLSLILTSSVAFCSSFPS